MRAVIQRVATASVEIDGERVAAIGQGLLVLLGLDREDDTGSARRMLEKLLAYRVFSDEAGRMNRSVVDVAGGVLLVSQFTLSADTRKGLRPGFSAAMPPGEAEPLFDYLLAELRARHPRVEAGVFGADMQVSLVNDGPVTFLLES
tara:strand:+ start:13762 stop:14199 length:438 start_codon:yes stop_codon:yes gene_type:complete